MEFSEVLKTVMEQSFPIAAYILMFWHMIQQTKMIMEIINKHQSESEESIKAINNNTLALTELKQMLADMKEGTDNG